MPAYTPAGRKLLDRIEGFTRYLSVAEKEDLAREKAPPMTGERFAQFLPYAQALDVEEAWSGRLVAAVGIAAAAELTREAVGTWYQSSQRSGDFTPTNFASSLSSLSSSLGSAISSSSTPPGSSSGGGYSGSGGGYRSSSSSSSSSGGGGGSSGGGGGGGGGGGW